MLMILFIKLCFCYAIGMNNHQFCIAPMMAISDRHFRYMWRLISPSAMLYTEMLTAQALIHGDRNYLLRHHRLEGPLALQLGGSDPECLSQACRLAGAFDFAEINLNVGCPSPRVQAGGFGAYLLKYPDLLADCVQAMVASSACAVTVKTRLAVDEWDDQAQLVDLLGRLADCGCHTFIIHARKAWLKGLNPKQNRSVPPLQYDRVYDLKSQLPHLKIVINGGIRDMASVESHLAHVDGVMIGRAAYESPMAFAAVEPLIWGNQQAQVATFKGILAGYLPYMAEELDQGTSLQSLVKPLISIKNGTVGARAWRRFLSDSSAHKSCPKKRFLALKEKFYLSLD